MRRSLVLGIVIVGAVTLPAAAGAVTPIAPADGVRTTSTPSFRWALAPGEEVFSFELSPNPAPGENGAFADDRAKRVSVLAKNQTGFAVGNADPLPPGTWFWHVNVFGPDFDQRWTPVWRIRVRDDPIRLLRFKLLNLRCIRRLSVDFEYTDNSVGKPARYRLDFRRSKRGRLAAVIKGRAVDGREFKQYRFPRRLGRGRYVVRLKVKDARGHRDRSGLRRMRVERC
jgi:hypothetical protein